MNQAAVAASHRIRLSRKSAFVLILRMPGSRCQFHATINMHEMIPAAGL
jgi:hypothetical protein